MDEHQVALTADAGIPIWRPTWALIRDGVVELVKRGGDFVAHPFGELDGPVYQAPLDGRQAEIPRAGLAVLRVTGHDVAPGYLVDLKGNCTPREGRAGPIAPHLPAYHQGPGKVESTANLASAIAGDAPATETEPAAAQNETIGGTVEASEPEPEVRAHLEAEAEDARNEAPDADGD